MSRLGGSREIGEIDLDKEVLYAFREKQISVLENYIKFMLYVKEQALFEELKTILGNPGELLNTKITEIESFEIKENGDNLSITFNLVQ
jgi:hypothetical protein